MPPRPNLGPRGVHAHLTWRPHPDRTLARQYTVARFQAFIHRSLPCSPNVRKRAGGPDPSKTPGLAHFLDPAPHPPALVQQLDWVESDPARRFDRRAWLEATRPWWC